MNSSAAADPLADLEVVHVGRGAPMLLLHGPTPVRADLPFVSALREHVEIVAPSHPGFGRSARPEHVDSMYDLVHLYLDIIEHLPYEQVAVLGLSVGGWLAAELACVCAHKIGALILVDPVGVKLGARDERDITHLFNTPPAELEACAWHDPSRRPRGPFGLGWQMHVDDATDEDLELLARSWDALCLYGWRPHLYNPHLKWWLHRIRIPTLMLWGASDRIVSPEYGRAYSQLIPGARFEVIARAGHHPELEQPETVASRIAAFLQESGG
jgi:pimeloyl-ACP methyl ester carboxylesterase